MTAQNNIAVDRWMAATLQGRQPRYGWMRCLAVVGQPVHALQGVAGVAENRETSMGGLMRDLPCESWHQRIRPAAISSGCLRAGRSRAVRSGQRLGDEA